MTANAVLEPVHFLVPATTGDEAHPNRTACGRAPDVGELGPEVLESRQVRRILVGAETITVGTRATTVTCGNCQRTAFYKQAAYDQRPGGRRKGAGRPTIEPHAKRQRTNLWVHTEVLEVLDGLRARRPQSRGRIGRESRGAVVRRLLEEVPTWWTEASAHRVNAARYTLTRWEILPGAGVGLSVMLNVAELEVLDHYSSVSGMSRSVFTTAMIARHRPDAREAVAP